DGEQVVWLAREGEVTHPRTGSTVRPRLLGAGEVGGESDRTQALADWVARPDNPFFARAQVNRVWLHLMGRGLVDPNDDFRATNPPTNPELLDWLAKDFAKGDFRLKRMVKTVMSSRVYQLAAAARDATPVSDSPDSSKTR